MQVYSARQLLNDNRLQLESPHEKPTNVTKEKKNTFTLLTAINRPGVHHQHLFVINCLKSKGD